MLFKVFSLQTARSFLAALSTRVWSRNVLKLLPNKGSNQVQGFQTEVQFITETWKRLRLANFRSSFILLMASFAIVNSLHFLFPDIFRTLFSVRNQAITASLFGFLSFSFVPIILTYFAIVRNKLPADTIIIFWNQIVH